MMEASPILKSNEQGSSGSTSADAVQVNPKLHLPFLIQLALNRAPKQLQCRFQGAFLTFTQVVLRQRQLLNTRFGCDKHFDPTADYEDVLYDICTTFQLEREKIDLDRAIWLNHEILSRFFIRPGQWVNLCKFSDTGPVVDQSNTNETTQANGSDKAQFTCQILPQQSTFKSGSEHLTTTIYMNPVTEYNLRRALNILPFVPIPDLQLKPLLTDPVVAAANKSISFSPIQGASVKLQRLKSCNYIHQADCDILIREMFLRSHKYLCVGDIISCPYNNASFDVVIVEINDKQLEHGCEELFKMSSDSTKIVLDAQELSNQLHVTVPYDKVKKLIAPCVEKYFSKLERWIRQALIFNIFGHNFETGNGSELWPSFLVYGPVGSGKTSVCKTVAAYHGFNFHFVNGVNLIGDTSAYTEGKFRALHDQVRNSLCPAIVYIKNVHLVGKDKDGNEDKRAIFAFKEFLQDMASLSLVPPTDGYRQGTMNSRAVFVVGSTNFSEFLVSSVAQNFLFKLEFSSFINSIKTTEGTLRWLLDKGGVHIEEGIDLGAWVKDNCEGMKRGYGDLKAFVAGVVRIAFTRTKSDSKWTNHQLLVTGDDLNQGLKEIDTTLKRAASTIEIPKVSWEDIGGLEEIKKELISSVKLPLEYPHLFASGIRRSGILLYGPPGTGKTLIAKAVATEFKLSFLSVKGPELLNMYVGQSEQNVRNVFEKARNSAPCIIFFDELDALAPNRGRAGDSGGVMDRVVSQILAELDGTHSTPDVFIIGATNRPDLIDSALLRPGRFDKLLYVGVNQDVNSKTSVLKALTRKFLFDEDVNLSTIASMLPNGMSGADLYSLCSDTYMMAVERHIFKLSQDHQQDAYHDANSSKDSQVLISMQDFEAAISRAATTLSDEDQAKYEALRMMTR